MFFGWEGTNPSPWWPKWISDPASKHIRSLQQRVVKIFQVSDLPRLEKVGIKDRSLSPERWLSTSCSFSFNSQHLFGNCTLCYLQEAGWVAYLFIKLFSGNGDEAQALLLLGNCSTTNLHSQLPFYFRFLIQVSIKLLSHIISHSIGQ